MLTGAFLRNAACAPDGVDGLAPAGGLDGEALILVTILKNCGSREGQRWIDGYDLCCSCSV